MSWLEKLIPPSIKRSTSKHRRSVPEGLWLKCESCEAVLYRTDIEHNLKVCPKCDFHMKISARERLNYLLDQDSRCEIGQEILPIDTLKFKDIKKYTERLKSSNDISGETDAIVILSGTIMSLPVVVACFEFEFMGGSMGAVVGERFVRGVQNAIDRNIPFICFTATGGARMQEGLISLMQMVKTSSIIHKLSKKKIPFITVLTNPTMGGVSASFAFMGDIVIAEPKALIGFAGSRVIKNTVQEKLPDGFQRSEFILQKGAIDMIIDRRKMREEIARILALLMKSPTEALL